MPNSYFTWISYKTCEKNFYLKNEGRFRSRCLDCCLGLLLPSNIPIKKALEFKKSNPNWNLRSSYSEHWPQVNRYGFRARKYFQNQLNRQKWVIYRDVQNIQILIEQRVKFGLHGIINYDANFMIKIIVKITVTWEHCKHCKNHLSSNYRVFFSIIKLSPTRGETRVRFIILTVTHTWANYTTKNYTEPREILTFCQKFVLPRQFSENVQLTAALNWNWIFHSISGWTTNKKLSDNMSTGRKIFKMKIVVSFSVFFFMGIGGDSFLSSFSWQYVSFAHTLWVTIARESPNRIRHSVSRHHTCLSCSLF